MSDSKLRGKMYSVITLGVVAAILVYLNLKGRSDVESGMDISTKVLLKPKFTVFFGEEDLERLPLKLV